MIYDILLYIIYLLYMSLYYTVAMNCKCLLFDSGCIQWRSKSQGKVPAEAVPVSPESSSKNLPAPDQILGFLEYIGIKYIP